MKPIRFSLINLGALLLATGSASASTTVYWDTNYTGAGCGNTGSSWEGVNWSSDATGASATVLWVDGDRANFSAGTDGTATWHVALGATITTPSITWDEPFAGNDDWRSINGGTINIGGGMLNSSALGFNPGNGYDVNINSVLAGSGGLTIAAHGDATSNNGGGGGAEFRLQTTNTFSGGLTITSGLVSFNSNANLGDASNLITLNGGGLLYTDNVLSLPRDIKVGTQGGTIRLYGGKTLTIEGTIANAVGVVSAILRRTDGGNLILKGSGAGFTGTFINGASTTELAAVDANWANTDFVSEAGANLNPNGTGTAVVNSLNTKADVIIDNGTTLNVDTGAITMGPANGHWYKTNTGTLGMLTSSSGTLTFTNGATTGNLTTIDHQIQVQLVDSGTTPVALVKKNNNSLVLTAANTYTGGTTINGGRVQVQNATAFGTGPVTVNSGGQAFLTSSATHPNNFTINGLGVTEDAGTLGAIRFGNASKIGGTLTVATAARITAYDASETGTIAGPLTGSAALEKTGAGTIVISGSAATYTGTLTVNAGIVKLDNTFGGNVVVNDNGNFAGEGTVAGNLTLGVTTGVDLYVNGVTSASLSANNLTLNGLTLVNLTSLPTIAGSAIPVIAYTGTLTMTGTADDNLDLVGASAYRGIPVFANTGSAITLTVPAGADLVWRGEDLTNPGFWDNNTTANWKNGATAADYFFAGDNVLFDDTGITRNIEMRGMLSPASVTFNNSAGNDYTITAPDQGGKGFTGATGIVKNNTGTVTLGGYSHNYTGAVIINDGVLQPSGNYELLGNASSVTINDSVNGGGQLNIAGANLGNGQRHYSFTIAGNGTNGLGAITNTGGDVYENAGIFNLTLTANASVGGFGGRFDIGRSGGTFGAITGNGFTLTKVGGGAVCMRAPAPNLTYIVAAGTLKFEDSDTATGPNAIAVNAGTLQSYGNRTFTNTLNFAASTTLDNDGGGMQTWTGPLNLTGEAGTTVYLSARGDRITLTGVISGNSNVVVNAGNVLYLTGSASNTYTGTTTLSGTGQLVLSKTGGTVAIPGDLFLSANGTRGIASAALDNQLALTSVLHFAGNGDTRLELKGTTQTVAGIDSTGATGGYQCIQHSEFGTPAPIGGSSNLVINPSGTSAYTYSGVLRDQGGLMSVTKTGTGTQTLLGGLIDFNGPTVVTEGRMIVNSDDTWTIGVAIATSAVYEANVTSATDTMENRHAAFTLTGAGTYQKSGTGNLSMGWDGGASVAMASGGLIDIVGGSIRLEYGSNTTWTANKGDLTIAAGASLDLWDNNNAGVFVDALNGGGEVIRSNGSQTGSLTVGVDNGSGDFAGSISNATGTTHLIKMGTGTQTLSGVNTYSGNTTVNAGTLALASTGSLRFVITNTASNGLGGAGSVTLNGSFAIDTSAATVATGTWTLVNTATLAYTYGESFTLGAGWTKTAGVWKSTDATGHAWTFTEASGKLTVSLPYASWIAGFFPGVTDPTIIGTTADPDRDGIANAVEMVLGGNPAATMDAALLPTVEMVHNPAGLAAGDYLLFTYRRTDLSVGVGVVVGCEYDADLIAPWATAQNGEAGVVVQMDDNYASFTPPATATYRVRVYVPKGSNAKLLGRLNVMVP
jgi:autotransporter-associated beta strand protein